MKTRRTYRGNPTQGRIPRVRARAKPAHVVRGIGFDKIFDPVIEAAKSSLAKKRLHSKNFQMFII